MSTHQTLFRLSTQSFSLTKTVKFKQPYSVFMNGTFETPKHALFFRFCTAIELKPTIIIEITGRPLYFDRNELDFNGKSQWSLWYFSLCSVELTNRFIISRSQNFIFNKFFYCNHNEPFINCESLVFDPNIQGFKQSVHIFLWHCISELYRFRRSKQRHWKNHFNKLQYIRCINFFSVLLIKQKHKCFWVIKTTRCPDTYIMCVGK